MADEKNTQNQQPQNSAFDPKFFTPKPGSQQNHVFPESQDINQQNANGAYNSSYQEEDLGDPYQENPQLEQAQAVYSNPVVPMQPMPDYSQEAFFPGQNAQPNQETFTVGDQTPQVQKTVNKNIPNDPNQKKKFDWSWKSISEFLTAKWWVVIGVVLAVALIIIGIFAWVGQPAEYGSNDFTNVTARIEGPSTSPSGTPGLWKVTIQNQETVSIRNIEVNLQFDRSFQYLRPINPDPANPQGNLYRFDSLAGLGQGTSEVIIQFEGVLTGNIDDVTLMTGSVKYTPTPLLDQVDSTRAVSIQASETTITAPEISIELTPTTQTIQNGGAVELIATFENLSERDLKDVRITMDYPDGSNFTYTASTLQIQNTDPVTTPTNGNNQWEISTLPRLQKQSLTVKGNLFGADGIRQPFRVEIEIANAEGGYDTLAQDSVDIEVTSQPLVISTKIDGKDSNRIFEPGETLTFTIEYQNRSNTTIQNVELFALIDDPANVLDYSTLTFTGGDVGNLNNRIIQWRGSGVPQLVNLTPQVRGQLQYSIRVKDGDSFIQSNLNQSSYTLRPRAQAKATNLQQFEVAGELYKGEGELVFTQKSEELENTGNQANRKVYNITWELRTRQNQVNDVTVETITNLPPTAWRQASINPGENAGEIDYDPLTGRIIWTPGNIPGYTGITSPIKRISFELIVESTESGRTELYGDSTVTGIDDFTGVTYEFTSPALDS